METNSLRVTGQSDLRGIDQLSRVIQHPHTLFGRVASAQTDAIGILELDLRFLSSEERVVYGAFVVLVLSDVSVALQTVTIVSGTHARLDDVEVESVNQLGLIVVVDFGQRSSILQVDREAVIMSGLGKPSTNESLNLMSRGHANIQVEGELGRIVIPVDHLVVRLSESASSATP